MYKKILAAGIVVIFMMTSIASASVRPSFVEVGPYGLMPAEWMAIIVIICAFIDNIGRFADKRIKDSTLKYNYAFFNATIIASVSFGLIALGLGVTELGIYEILTAIGMGFGGNLTVKEATKGTR